MPEDLVGCVCGWMGVADSVLQATGDRLEVSRMNGRVSIKFLRDKMGCMHGPDSRKVGSGWSSQGCARRGKFAIEDSDFGGGAVKQSGGCGAQRSRMRLRFRDSRSGGSVLPAEFLSPCPLPPYGKLVLLGVGRRGRSGGQGWFEKERWRVTAKENPCCPERSSVQAPVAGCGAVELELSRSVQMDLRYPTSFSIVKVSVTVDLLVLLSWHPTLSAQADHPVTIQDDATTRQGHFYRHQGSHHQPIESVDSMGCVLIAPWE